jgi:ATP synthase protein I
LARLGAEIDTARRERSRQEGGRRSASPQGALGLGLRVAVELVSALCVGAAFGWICYRFLPAPWGVIGLIVFFFLGVAAGMLNVFRTAKGVAFGAAPPPSDDGDGSRRG